MRKLITFLMVAFATVFAVPAIAADIPVYPDIEVPEVDYDLGGSFYLRGSAAINVHWAKEAIHPDACVCGPFAINQLGYGYSWGAGFGYETGNGLRFDATIDSVETAGLRITKTGLGAPQDGNYTMMLRSTLALANVYYDFGLGGYGHKGGAFAYVGAGAGLAWNHVETNAPQANPVPTGGNITGAAAIMAGVGYDLGTWVVDAGYRGVYLAQVNNAPTQDPNYFYTVDNNFIHEVRGTVRYRFN